MLLNAHIPLSPMCFRRRWQWLDRRKSQQWWYENVIGATRIMLTGLISGWVFDISMCGPHLITAHNFLWDFLFGTELSLLALWILNPIPMMNSNKSAKVMLFIMTVMCHRITRKWCQSFVLKAWFDALPSVHDYLTLCSCSLVDIISLPKPHSHVMINN